MKMTKVERKTSYNKQAFMWSARPSMKARLHYIQGNLRNFSMYLSTGLWFILNWRSEPFSVGIWEVFLDFRSVIHRNCFNRQLFAAIYSVFTLSQAIQFHSCVYTGHCRGKVRSLTDVFYTANYRVHGFWAVIQPYA